MIDRNHRLALTKQAALLGICRGSVYYEPAPVSDADLALMRRLDELHLEFPFAGSRMLRGLLAAEGSKVGRRHVTTLMRRMGIEAIYRRPNTSKPAPGHRIYPYLLRGLTINRPNHVWATDISYIPMARGFVYLTAVMDWFTRRILAWRLSNTMEAFVLHRCCRGSPCKTRLPANLQHRSGQPVHQYRIHQRADQQRHLDQHGRQGRMARQRFCRALLACAFR